MRGAVAIVFVLTRNIVACRLLIPKRFTLLPLRESIQVRVKGRIKNALSATSQKVLRPNPPPIVLQRVNADVRLIVTSGNSFNL